VTAIARIHSPVDAVARDPDEVCQSPVVRPGARLCSGRQGHRSRLRVQHLSPTITRVLFPGWSVTAARSVKALLSPYGWVFRKALC
jgi:hypothetical protein